MKLSALTKKLLAVLAGILLLILLEGMLAFIGVPSLDEEDSFAGFSAKNRTFVATEDGYYKLNPAKEKYFNQQSFPVKKSAGSFRIIAVGGSTTYGRPYLKNTAFSSWLTQLLERYAPQKSYETINAGGISYASYRVRRLLNELVEYQPDLLLVYAGHNEFLEARTFADLRNEGGERKRLRELLHSSHLYSLLKRSVDRVRQPPADAGLGEEVKARLEQIGGPELYHRDARFKQQVVSQYRQEILSIVRLAKAKKIPLVLCTLPSNLSGVSPFKSEHRIGLTTDELKDWNEAVLRAEELFVEQKYSEALKAFSAAERIDDQYAQLHYRMGQALAALGQYREAYMAFDRAKEEDIVPLRALDEFNKILREIAVSEKVSLADVEATFVRVSPAGLVGDNLMADHVHPTLEGQQLVAWVIMNAATRDGLVPLSAKAWQRNLKDARQFLRDEVAKIPARYRAMGVWGVGRLYFWAGKYPEAYKALLAAWAEVKDIAEIPYQLGQLELYRGDSAQALNYLQAALKLNSFDAKVRLVMAEAYLMDGQGELALQTLQKLPAGVIDTPKGNFLRGRALARTGRPEEGVQLLKKAVQQAPAVASFHLALANTLLRDSQRDLAVAEYRIYLELIRHPDAETELAYWLKTAESEER